YVGIRGSSIAFFARSHVAIAVTAYGKLALRRGRGIGAVAGSGVGAANIALLGMRPVRLGLRVHIPVAALRGLTAYRVGIHAFARGRICPHWRLAVLTSSYIDIAIATARPLAAERAGVLAVARRRVIAAVLTLLARGRVDIVVAAHRRRAQRAIAR